MTSTTTSGTARRPATRWRTVDIVVGAVLEQADQDFAQHVDLARRAVAGVHLDAAVARGDHAGRALGVGRAGVAAQVVLKPPQQRGRRLVRSRKVHVDRPGRAEGPAQLAGVAPQGGQQRVADPLRRAVLAAAYDAVGGLRAERLPQGQRGLRQPQVHVAVGAERGEQVDLGE